MRGNVVGVVKEEWKKGGTDAMGRSIVSNKRRARAKARVRLLFKRAKCKIFA